jgi:exosome complex component RRP4
VTNIIRVLASHFVPLTDTALLEAYEGTIEHERNVTDLLNEDFGDSLVASILSPQ